MTTATVVLEPTTELRTRPFDAIADTATIAQRNLITLRRVPQLLVFSTVQPVIFVLLFRYVFGGAIRVPGVPYVDFLMPGVFAQTVAFGAMNTAIGLATDLNTGLIERFRSLPMARSAVLAGRTLADAARNVFVVALMVAVGFAVGFRVHTNPVAFLGAMALLVLFGYALSWVFAAVGLAVANPETAQAAAFPLLAPMVFASSAFVPVASMPGWLQAFARNQPLSVVVSASRALVLGGPTATHVLHA
ncbi:MAG TPA: ABC transporter permease, partial [Acidimicrobiales bacterium]|nr:ABC transporter permease [Acidimicrobiales bacterium]